MNIRGYLIAGLLVMACSPEDEASLDLRGGNSRSDALLKVAVDEFSSKVSADGLTTPPGYMPHALLSRRGYLTIEDLRVSAADNLFTMDGIAGTTLEYALPMPANDEPIKVALSDDGQELCANASYRAMPPQLKDVPAEEGSFLSCLRLRVGQRNIVYFTAPLFSVGGAAPSAALVKIEGGAKVTGKALVNLTLSAEAATEMYITNNVSCSEGGYWEPYAAKKIGWELEQRDAKASVYAKFRNNIGAESACVSGSISHRSDYLKKVELTLNNGSLTTNSQMVSLHIANAEGASEMYVTNTPGCSEGGSWEPFVNPRTAWMLGSFNTETSVYLQVRDLSGSASLCVSAHITHDNTPPGSPSLVLAGGAVSTNSPAVDLSLVASDATRMYITNTVGCGAGGVWEAYSSSKTAWVLGQTNSLATVYGKFHDAAGNESPCVSASIVQASQSSALGYVTINNGSLYTNQSQVSLSLGGGEAGSMYLTNNVGCTSGGVWEPFASLKSGWTLSNSNSLATVYAKFQFGSLEGPCVAASITHDTIAPLAGSMTLAGGASVTNQAIIPLSLSATGADSMKLNNSADCSGPGSWVPYEASIGAYSLLYANATNQISVKYRDLAGNESSCVTSSIVHNNIAPAAASVSIAGGLSHTASLTVSLSLSVINASDMYITNTANCAGDGVWETYASNKSAWLLSQANATNNVYAKFRDTAGNQSACVSASIIHDDTAPTGSVLINGGASSTANASASLSLTASGASAMYITNTAGCSAGGNWVPFAASRSWTLPLLNDSNTVYVKFRDVALNESVCLSSSIAYYHLPTIAIAGSPFVYTAGAVAGINPSLGDSVNAVSISPALANGLSLNTVTGAITGTTSGTLSPTTYTLTASNAIGQTATVAISIGIYAAPTIAVTGTAFTYTKNTTISNITPSLGSSVTAVAISPALPAGLAFNTTTGVVSGTPSVTSSPAVTYTVTAANAAGATASATFDITINDMAPSISVAGSPFAYTTGDSVSITPTLGSSVSSVAISPALGNNLSMSTSTGVISGTTSGTLAATTYTLTASNSTGQTATTTISIAIYAPPGALSLVIDGNASHTAIATVSLALSATNATDMYVTNASGCGSGGSWEAYATSKTGWTLAQSNATATVYVKFRNAAGTNSGCISDTIIHDDTPPGSPAISIAAGAAATKTALVNLTLAATGASEMYITNTLGCTSGGSWGAYATSSSAWSLAQTNAIATVYIKFRDEALNTSACVSDTILHDDTAPSNPSNFTDGVNTLVNSSSPTMSWTASSDGGSGLSRYEIAIGTTAGGTDVTNWTSTGTATSAAISGLSLTSNTMYYGSLRAIDNAENVSAEIQGNGFYAGLIAALDTSFNTTGIATHASAAGGVGSDIAQDLAIQSNNKIVVVGSSYNGANLDMAVWRYNTNGSLDTSFNSTGYFTQNGGAGNTNNNDYATAVALQADGKIVVAGYGCQSGSTWTDFIVWRFNSNGTLDTSFNSVGYKAWGLGALDILRDVQIQSDGKIIVVGETYTATYQDLYIARLNSDGSLDTSFNSTGYFVHNGAAGGSSSDVGNAGAIQSNGKIVVAGQSGNGTNDDMVVWRFNANGTLDTSFNATGYFTHNNAGGGNGNDKGLALALDPNDKIVVSGVTAGNGTSIDFVVWRLNTNGSLDTSFNTTGYFASDYGWWANDNAFGVTVQSDGKILFVGYAGNGGSNSSVFGRLNSDGTRDTNFGANGFFTVGPAVTNTSSHPKAVALDGNGRIIGVGERSDGSTLDMAIWAVKRNGE